MSDRRTATLEATARLVARRGVRGLRVEEVAAEAGISKALIYYHFGDRAGLVRRTLTFISDRAERYTAAHTAASSCDPLEELEQSLLLEFQDSPIVRENSIAWGELRASAVFDSGLRDELALASLIWAREVANLLGLIRPTARESALVTSAERLTVMVEGLSNRWLGGTLPLDHARTLMREAVAVEVERLATDSPPVI
ncbi:TetR/AcrR family transcriptional regulator [Streptomyces sp. Tue6028]|uniref:TetR/AcrR family transcriptional regulator n=1 Tax=Streptomyces sp. Tue6028 TaxID=2036037 RepID=UPI003EB7B52B